MALLQPIHICSTLPPPLPPPPPPPMLTTPKANIHNVGTNSKSRDCLYSYAPRPHLIRKGVKPVRQGLNQARNERTAVRSGLGVLQRVTVRAMPRYVPQSHVGSCHHRTVFLYETLATGEQSCARGFQSLDTVKATFRTPRNRQYIFPSLNFSCGGVIGSWVLQRFENNRGRVLVGEMIALQLWRQKAGAALIYTLQTQQTHTARTNNALSYAFTASPTMTVAAGDVFGFYIPSGTGTTGGLRVATAVLSNHTVFTSQTAAAPTEFTVMNAGAHNFPLISIEFSKSLEHKMIT